MEGVINKNAYFAENHRVINREVPLTNSNMSANAEERDITTVHDMMVILWENKVSIALLICICAILSVIYARSLPDIYEAKVVVMPSSTEGQSGLGNIANSLGGLASLAGVSIGSGGSDKIVFALETLKSRQFNEDLISKYDMTIPLVAGLKYDMDTNELILDEQIYDIRSEQWVRQADGPLKSEPTPWETFQRFKELVTISQESETGVVTISVKHFSPMLAKKWARVLVEEINSFVRLKERNEAERSIEFLEAKLSDTKLSDMRNIFYQLIEEQTKTMMLAEVKVDYVFTVIDSSSVPDVRAEPNRLLLVLLGTMIGAILGILIAVLRSFKKNKIFSDGPGQKEG